MSNRNIIVAYDSNRAIGIESRLLWDLKDMRADMKHFRALTLDSTVIMGRKTLESIGAALPRRRNIVLSRLGRVSTPGVEVVSSLESAYGISADNEDVFVIGGADVYRQAVQDADKVFATEVEASINGADTFFPLLDDSWRVASSEQFTADKDNIYNYRFVTYERN